MEKIFHLVREKFHLVSTTGQPGPGVCGHKSWNSTCVSAGQSLHSGSAIITFVGTSSLLSTIMVLSPSDIQGVRLEDEGFFVCSAFSVAGSLATKAYLEVTAVGNEPPPIIRVGRSGYLEQPFIVVDPADKKFS